MKLDYRTVWRWHFYAGLFLAPVLVFLAVTGSVYLFDEEIDAARHGHLYEVQARQTTLPPADQLSAVRRARPLASVRSFRPAPSPGRTARVGTREEGRAVTVFVDPHDGAVVGSLVPAETLTEVVRDLHEKFLSGRIGNWIVEAAASWLVVLLLMGLYLWWPRERSLGGTFVPRLNEGGRTFWRDLHAVTGFWLAIFLLFQATAGLAWTDVWGDTVKKVAASVDAGFPAEVPFNPPDVTPESTVPTGDVADGVPWAAQELAVPASRADGHPPIALGEVVRIAEERGVPAGYTIHLPRGEKGVYTVVASGARPQDAATLHLDQYSGEVLTDLRFEDYGVVAKAISVGIMIHQGDYFGWPNKLLVLGIAMGLVLMVVSAGVMWWRRKPGEGLGAPAPDAEVELPRWTGPLVAVLAVLLPLFGATLVLVLVVDAAIVRRIPALERRLR